MGKRRGVVQSMCWFRAMALVGVLTLLWVPVSPGQTTSITSSGLNTQVSHVAGQPNYDITGGTRPGNDTNLFHGFGDFSVGTNHTANFLNDSGLPTSNILGRVTGGNPSNIFGTIQTTGFGNANLFFMNPAGIVFGPNASLNVGGSVTFTTADYIKLADGVRFKALANTTSDTLLSAVPVATFGFLGSTPGAITVLGSQLSVAEGKGISLVGGNTQITGGTTITAPGGQINLVSLAGRGEARIAPVGITIAGTIPRGQIMIKGGTEPENVVRLDTSSAQGGAVVIRGGRLSLARAGITTEAKAANQTGGAIVIEATKSATVDNTGLHTGPTVESDARITVEGGSVSLTSPSVRASNVTIDTTGNWGGLAGDVTINVRNFSASRLNISTDPSPSVFPSGPGAGKVALSATGNLTLRDSFILTGSGEIAVRAARTTLTNSFVGTSSEGGGLVGNIVLDVGRLTMKAAAISTEGRDAQGGGGNIRLSARDATLIDGGGVRAGGIGRADGGSITVSTPHLTLTHLGSIRTDVDGPRGGDISVNVRTLNMFNGGRISTRASFGGSSSNINIVASQSISMAGVGVDNRGLEFHSGINSSSEGRTGSIHLIAPTMTLSDGALVRTTSLSSGDQGPIILDVARLNLLRGASVESSGFGTASMVINAAETVTLDKGSITARADEGGNVNLRAGKSIELRNGSLISADHTDVGDAGHIAIQAGEGVVIRDSTISTQAEQGNGGTIDVDAKQVALTNSQLTTSVSGGPDTVGGRIVVDAKNVTLRNSQILSTATEGDGGTIHIRSRAFHRDARSVIDASSESGTDGTVTIESRR
ncbi:hypothetical protein YTPLAS72_10110 [Nitrospira sp.]|nr:hypothetical protein YTPLAS72_10110 [Nitrospira sp.]